MQTKSLFYIKISLIFAVVLVLGIYFFHQSKTFLLGPQLYVEQPESGQTLTRSFISVNGIASNSAILLINDQEVLVDSFGNFNKNLILTKGYNIVELIARDKFNREVYKRLEVVVK